MQNTKDKNKASSSKENKPVEEMVGNGFVDDNSSLLLQDLF